MDYKRALIVDGDQDFCLVTQGALQETGISEFQIEHDGLEAINAIKDPYSSFDLVLCDLNMPNVDGVSFIRQLAERHFAGSMIIVSDEEMDVIETVGRLARLKGISVVGAVQKPVSAADLKALLVAGQSTKANGRNDADLSRDEAISLVHQRRFNPYYQPKLNLRSMKVESVEVLGRILLDGGDHGGPLKFLTAAEEYGLISEATDDLCMQVAEDMSKLHKRGHKIKASINLSPSSLHEVDLPDKLHNVFAIYDIAPSHITLEVTENRIVSESADTLEVLSRLRLKGFHLSLDDFGTGAASMEQLRNFPFNELKIDQSFIKDVTTNAFSRLAVESAYRIGKQMDLNIVAEGVETREVLHYVRKLGVDEVQGFVVAKPLPLGGLMDWLDAIVARRKKNKPEANPTSEPTGSALNL